MLVCVCAALAWPGDSPIAAQAGGATKGDSALAWAFLAAATGAFVAYAAGVVALARRPSSPLALVAALGAAIQLAPLGAPLLLSTDAWTYWDYGRIAAVHEANPYRETPARFRDDPAYPWVGSGWRDSSTVYGPGFTLVSEPLALGAGSSHTAAAWLYKALAAAAVLVCVAIVARRSRRPAFGAAFVGWNPVLALHLAGGGHNDAWIGALVLAALALGASGRRQAAGAAWALGAAVKWIPLVFLPLRAVEARARGRRVGHLGFALAAAVVVAAASWRYGGAWLGAFGPLARNANRETRFALPHRVEQLGVPHVVAIVLFAAAFVLAYAWLLREAARGRARLGLAAALLLLATPYLAPWYLAWAVPLAALEDDRTAQLLSLGLCAYLLRQTIPV